MMLEIQDVGVQRAGRTVVAGATLSCAAGEAVVLRGPNGAGKTTLLRAVAGLLPATGTLRLGGVSLAEDREGYQAQLAYTGHLDAIKPQLSVAENLALWARVFGAREVGAVMARFDLSRIAERPAHACSAGQKRRLGLARLGLVPRALWVMDEPTVSLDQDTIALVEGEIAAHLATGGAALIATHVPLSLPHRVHALAPVTQAPRTSVFLEGAY